MGFMQRNTGKTKQQQQQQQLSLNRNVTVIFTTVPFLFKQYDYYKALKQVITPKTNFPTHNKENRKKQLHKKMSESVVCEQKRRTERRINWKNKTHANISREIYTVYRIINLNVFLLPRSPWRRNPLPLKKIIFLALNVILALTFLFLTLSFLVLKYPNSFFLIFSCF